jgi:hypothetical protein
MVGAQLGGIEIPSTPWARKAIETINEFERTRLMAAKAG